MKRTISHLFKDESIIHGNENKSDKAMIYSHQTSDSTKRKTVTHSFNYPFTCHREKPVFEGNLQTTVLKKNMK